MKTFQKISLLLLTIILLSSCATEYDFALNVTKKVTLNDKFTATFQEKNGNEFEKVTFFLNGKELQTSGNSFEINTADLGVGKHQISALVKFNGESKRVNNSFEVLSNVAPTIYDYEIVNTYPHDPKAYTQGLEYQNGYLYESTGRKGESTVRKVELKTGKILQKIDVPAEFFGEGITIYNDKIYHLTWQAKKGFVYDLKTLEKEKEFTYNRSKEGWGFTHSDTELIKSDGTNKIWFLDPETLKEKRSIQAYTNKYAVKDLNELEMIDGKVYANKWQQNAIVIINPENGVITGVANLDGLKQEVEKTQTLDKADDVLNGIAYDAENDRLFVTGKNWSKLFEIKLIPRQ